MRITHACGEHSDSFRKGVTMETMRKQCKKNLMPAACVDKSLMRGVFLVASLLIAFPPLTALGCSGPKPYQQQILKMPPVPAPEARFRFDAPPRMQFSAEEQLEQRARGKELLSRVRAAFDAGSPSVQIPPGHYRFASAAEQGGKAEYAVLFENLQRHENNPFVIEATGVTLWFDLPNHQAPPGHRCLGFRRCRNIVLRGATLARTTPGQVEGRITRIDAEGNRLEIALSPGVSVPKTFHGSDEQRILPFKADGRFCAPLYDLQPGIRKLRYNSITPSTDGRYWVQLRDPDLIARIQDAEWKKQWGELGTLSVGDGICCLYVTGSAITLEHSANLTMHGLSVYVDKGGPVEMGGDGAHLWKDCYFGPQPGTSQWKGADGFLSRSLRHGSTFDNVTIRHTADDLANFHGVWGKVQSVSGTVVTFERNASLRPTLANARAGDRLRFIHRKTGVFLGEAKLVSLKEFTVTIDRDAMPFAEGQASWPEHECAGWTVQNCHWEDSFQRILIMSGPGTIRGNKFSRWGSGIVLNTGMGLVGGIPNGITIEKNTFTHIAPRPRASAIEARAHNALGHDGVPAIEGLTIANNTFLHCGGPEPKLIGIKNPRIVNNHYDSSQ